MNSKTMLFQCLGYCKETYLADNLCDGYRCPKCSGYVTKIGLIKDLEEKIKEVRNKIKKAKKNGLIRNYYKSYISAEPNLPQNPNNYIGVVDLSSKKDSTVHTIKINVNAENIDKDKLIEKIIRDLNNPKGPGRNKSIKNSMI